MAAAGGGGGRLIRLSSNPLSLGLLTNEDGRSTAQE
eukprot:SAG25_NODE_3077_length_1228_cov_1.682905_1_plen_35_part_10